MVEARAQRARFAIALALVVGCKDDPKGVAPSPQPLPHRAETTPARTQTEDAGPAAGLEAGVAPLELGGDERATLDRLGAVPAWTAVVDRFRYLARRGDQGVVFGRVGDPPADGTAEGYRWLIDEREGNGALALRARLPNAVATGDRVVVWGAWAVDVHRHWYWRVDRVARLPAPSGSPADDPYPVAPGHEVSAMPAPPDGAVPISELATTGGVALFQVVRGPPRPGDGFAVADSSRLEAVAILHLPGDREPYGGQEMRVDDERWQLRRGLTYVVRVRRWRAPKKPEELPTLRAISAPIRVDPRVKPRDR